MCGKLWNERKESRKQKRNKEAAMTAWPNLVVKKKVTPSISGWLIWSSESTFNIRYESVNVRPYYQILVSYFSLLSVDIDLGTPQVSYSCRPLASKKCTLLTPWRWAHPHKSRGGRKYWLNPCYNKILPRGIREDMAKQNSNPSIA